MTIQKTPTALFVADSHFRLNPDAAELSRRDRFLSFLEMAAMADDLFLLGDIFDFWFDYPHFQLKEYDSIFQALDKLTSCNTRIHFVGGNHDIWAAKYFHEKYGSDPSGKPFSQTIGDIRVHVCHGDGLLSFDWAYNTFRSVVRNKVGIVLAKSMHPEVLFTLSTWLSGKSRKANRDQAAGIESKARKWLNKQSDAHWDMIIMGHVHHAYEYRTENKQLITLPGWIDDLGYGLLRDNKFQLLDFNKDSLL